MNVEILRRVYDSITSVSVSSSNATAPEFQPPVCCAFPAVLLWSGTWLTPTRGGLMAMLSNEAG